MSLPSQSPSENPRYVVTVLPSLKIAQDKSKDKTKRPLFQITKSLPEAYRAGEIQPIRDENTVITLLTVPMFCPKIRGKSGINLKKA